MGVGEFILVVVEGEIGVFFVYYRFIFISLRNVFYVVNIDVVLL